MADRETEERAWLDLLKWDECFDYSRDASDFARRWAETEADTVAMPADVGEWKASLESAFQAGMMFARLSRESGGTGGKDG